MKPGSDVQVSYLGKKWTNRFVVNLQTLKLAIKAFVKDILLFERKLIQPFEGQHKKPKVGNNIQRVQNCTFYTVESQKEDNTLEWKFWIEAVFTTHSIRVKYMYKLQTY